MCALKTKRLSAAKDRRDIAAVINVFENGNDVARAAIGDASNFCLPLIGEKRGNEI